MISIYSENSKYLSNYKLIGDTIIGCRLAGYTILTEGTRVRG